MIYIVEVVTQVLSKLMQDIKEAKVKGWSIEDHVTKVAEWIVMDFGLRILHKTKVSLSMVVLNSRN